VRYGAPAAAVVVLVGAGPVLHSVTADAHGTLPPRTAAQLLADVAGAKVKAVSGTVVETTDLGLPAVPSLGGTSGSRGGSADFSSLVSGSHTLRVWYAGPDKVRLSLLGQLGESDLVRNGRDVWAWSSHGNTATHWTVPAGGSDRGLMSGPTHTPVATPEQAAQAALRAIGPTTRVSTDPTAQVAGRPAYELDLTPRDPRSLVGSVRIAIDGATHVPTRVQVFARGATSPAFQVGFTSFSTATPQSSVFGFTPPPGATVKQGTPETGHAPKARSTAGQAPSVVGKGWTTVLVAHLPAGATGGATGSGAALPQALLRSLPSVSGSWGSGRVLRSALFSVVLTDDGRVAVGAVPPSLLYDALSRR
jgi:outer membrane lipoprotein-sorting protein